MRARIADEVEVLRWCIGWLQRLERGEMVVVNLRPDTECVFHAKAGSWPIYVMSRE